MTRHTLTRGVLALAVTVAAAAVWAPAPGAAAAGRAVAGPAAPALTIAPADREPAYDHIVFAGDTGYLHQPTPPDGSASPGLLWTTYDGTDVPVTHQPLVDLSSNATSGGGGWDGVIYRESGDTTGTGTTATGTGTNAGAKLVFDDLAHGTTAEAPDPGDYTVLRQFADRLLVRSQQAPNTLRLLSAGPGGTLTDTPVTGLPTGNATGVAGDARAVVLQFTQADGIHLAVVDAATGAATVLPGTTGGPAQVFLGSDRIGWFRTGRPAPTVHLVDRDDLAAPAATVQLPSSAGTVAYARFAGRWIVTADSPSVARLTATDPDTGTAVTLPGSADSATLAQAPDGSVVVHGGPDRQHWATERVTATGGDTPVVTTLTALPTYVLPVDGIALSGGRLYTGEHGAVDVMRRTITLGADPSYGDRAVSYQRLVPAGALTGTGDGYAQFVGDEDNPQDAPDEVLLTDGNDKSLFLNTGDAHDTLVAADRDRAVYDTGSPAVQHVVALGSTTEKPFTRAATAAALSGDTLWTAGAHGVLTATALPARTTTRTVDTGAPCTPAELQAAAGRWLYWSCGANGPAGVHDLTTGADIPVPAGHALLGDGYVVRHDTAAGQLVLTGLGGDTAAPDRVLAALPATGADDRGVTWSVDASGGGVAWTDADQDVLVADPGVPATPVAVLTTPPPAVVGDLFGWAPHWTLSRPAATATVTLTNAWGRTIRTATPTLSGTTVALPAAALEGPGTLPDSTSDRWNLTVTDTDGHRATVSGPATVDDGVPAFRAYAGDGSGGVITLNSTGTLTTHWDADLSGNAPLAESRGGAGWTTKALAVPFGDLNGDGCEDTLVRMSSGELRDYHTACDSTLSTPDHAYTSLGSGFGQYKWLGSSGDMTGDGRPDLLAWSSTTGDLSLYPGLAGGTLGAPKLLKANQTYVRLVAPGDVNGDGTGDLLAYDHAHTLWLLTGDGKGGLTARKSVFTNWGSGYTALTGAGDLNRDGRPDLVERDTTGHLWANPVTPTGTLGARYALSSGYGGYTAIF